MSPVLLFCIYQERNPVQTKEFCLPSLEIMEKVQPGETAQLSGAEEKIGSGAEDPVGAGKWSRCYIFKFNIFL